MSPETSPAPPSSGRTADGTFYERLAPSRAGSATNGDAPPIVLVHGLGLTRATWEAHVPLLAGRHAVVSYDLYGHGDSAPPPTEPSLALFSTQLLGLLDALGIGRAAVVGFSLGGMINRRFALDHPTRVAALGVLSSPHERGAEAQRLVEERAAATEAGGAAATLEATIARWFTPGFVARRPELIERVRGWVLANDPAVYARCRRVLATGVTELIRPEPAIDAPTLVMTAEHDGGSTPAMSRAIAAEIPGAEVVIVSALQHMGLMEAPEAFATPLLDFLERRLERRSPDR